jgi:hypothetical protein
MSVFILGACINLFPPSTQPLERLGNKTMCRKTTTSLRRLESATIRTGPSNNTIGGYALGGVFDTWIHG